MKKTLCFSLFVVAAITAYTQKNTDGIETVYVEGGLFEMGYTDFFDSIRCAPLHEVYLNSFNIGKYEVTNGQFCDYLNNSGKTLDEAKNAIGIGSRQCLINYNNGIFEVPNEYEQYPVTMVTWQGAEEFCLSIKGRLPTEAEWEYAARGGKKTKGYIYSGSNNASKVMVSQENIATIQKIGSLFPNELGIYDMSGNVAEYCYDWFKIDYYMYSKKKNPMGPNKPTDFGNSAKVKSVRGGSYKNPSQAGMCTSRAMYVISDSNQLMKYPNIGFRICLPVNH